MKNEKTLLSQEELGIYLSCLEGGLEYNLPFKINLDKYSPEEITKALKEIFLAHKSLFSQLVKDSKGDVYKEVVETEINIPVLTKMDESKWVQPFELLNSPLYRFEILHKAKQTTLYVDFHHIIMDGTSIKLFLNELEERLQNKQVEINELGSYQKAKQEQIDRSNEKNLKKCRDFYLSTYGAVDCESLPIIDKKDEQKAFDKKIIEIALSKDKVDAYRKKNLVHTASFFFAVYSKTIALFSSLDSAFFLTVNNGRDKDTVNSFGMFVKSFPIYTQIPSKGNIKSLIDKINLEYEENLKNSEYSFSDFVKDTSINPSSLFSYQGDDFYQASTIKAEVINSASSVGDFAVELFTFDKQYKMHISYRKDLYKEETILHFAELFTNIANEFLTKENIEDIDIISAKEKKLLMSFHQTNLENYSAKDNVVTLFKAQVKKHPSSLCLVYHENKYTYQEVDDISDIIASDLIANKHKKEEIAAILLPRSEWVPIISLGILKAGLAYQPLDTTYPDERLTFMVKDSKASILFTDKESEKHVEGFKGEVIYLDEISKLEKKEVEFPKISNEDLLILLYTSGSTGLPKGVLLEHCGVSYFVQCMIKKVELTSDSRMSSYASFGFDAGMHDMFLALCSGASLFIVDEEMRLDLKKMANYFKEN